MDSSKNNLFKKLKSVFLTEDESVAPKTTPNAQKPNAPSGGGNKIVKTNAATPPPPAPKPPQISAIPPVVDPKFLDILFKAMEANNLEGLDYLEFKQSLTALGQMNLDEATRYKSAFAMAAAMGATPAKLIESAQHYLQVLAKEDTNFQQALTNQQAQKIGKQQEEIGQMEQTIAHKAQQIKQLTEEITAIQQQMNEKKKLITEATAKINETKANFETAYQSVTGQIQTDVANMQRYL